MDTLTDREFEQAFRECLLPVTHFDHEAHLRLAWIHLKQYGLEIALENICTQLTAFVAHHGADDKYNTTLTVASIQMIHHFMGNSKAGHFPGFLTEFPQLKTNFKGLINSHYSMDIFNSEEAKARYLEPDILPFD
ncbi:hypothetical protein [Flagellimonas myxillae]|uniref:hypothetical protein n=1 Tax=Flagellimonas myxillae TaxID=2942214 RepID=UPI00201F48C8|nr:hypothetical protein [Muricauda myxillae]MCL6267463.1 hypothetical protein [Muricauda myxillae]